MPPCGFNEKAIAGLLQFVEGCYEDLLRKVDGVPKVDVEQAIKEELRDIREALESFNLKQEK